MSGEKKFFDRIRLLTCFAQPGVLNKVEEANQQRAEEGLDPLILPPDLDPELPHFSTNTASGNQILSDDTDYVMDDAPDDGECATNDDVPDSGECVIGKLSDDGGTVLCNVPDDGECVISKLSDDGKTVLSNVQDDGKPVLYNVPDDGECVIGKFSDDGETIRCNIPDDGECVIGKLSDDGKTVRCNIPDDGECVIGGDGDDADEKLLVTDYEDDDSIVQSSSTGEQAGAMKEIFLQQRLGNMISI